MSAKLGADTFLNSASEWLQELQGSVPHSTLIPAIICTDVGLSGVLGKVQLSIHCVQYFLQWPSVLAKVVRKKLLYQKLLKVELSGKFQDSLRKTLQRCK